MEEGGYGELERKKIGYRAVAERKEMGLWDMRKKMGLSERGRRLGQ